MADTDAISRPRPRRLNPFSFPSDTTFRFALLIVAVISSSLYIYNFAYYRVTPAREITAQFACHDPMTRAVESGAKLDPPAMDAIVKAANRCVAPFARRTAALVLGGAAALMALAGLIYLLTPPWLIRRRRLVPLSDDDAHGVAARFGELASEAGLEPAPTLLWNPLAAGGSALAFGRRGRTYVAVGAGLVTQFYKDRPVFDAVVRHELAHLANRDVAKAYLAVSIWRAFVVAALLPYAVMLVGQEGSSIWHAAWHLGALAVIVYLARNGVLRAREYYADVRASQWDEGSALPRVLAAVPARAAASWRGWLSVHPTAAQRLSVLSDTRSLFRLGIWDAVGAGLMAGLALPILADQSHTVINALNTPVAVTHAPTVAAIVVASLLGTVLGVGIWRAAFGARLVGEGTVRPSLIVLGLATGFLLGDALSLGGDGFRLPRPGFVVAVVVIMALLVYWLVAAADACVDAVPGSRSPRVFSAIGLLAAGLSAWAIGQLWVFDSRLILGGDRWLAQWTLLFSQEPLTWLMAAAILGLPLVALVAGRDRSGTTPAWAWLDSPAADAQWPERERPRVRTVLRWALAAGVAYALVVLVLHATGAKRGSFMGSLGAYFHGDFLSQFPEPERTAAAWKTGWIEFQQYFAYALVAVAATVAAMQSRRFQVLNALFAGCVAAAIAVPALLILHAAFGGVSGLDFTLLWAKLILAPAVFIALAAGIAVAGVRQTIHWVTSRRSHGAVAPRSREFAAA